MKYERTKHPVEWNGLKFESKYALAKFVRRPTSCIWQRITYGHKLMGSYIKEL